MSTAIVLEGTFPVIEEEETDWTVEVHASVGADATHLRGVLVSATAPAAGEAPVFNGTAYVPTNVATQAAFAAHVADVANPHAVTKSQVGLGSVENTALSTWAGSGSLTMVGTLASGAVPASLVTAGTFGAGDYTFPASLTTTTLRVNQVASIRFDVNASNVTFTRSSTNSTGALLIFQKSRGGDVNTPSAVSNADDVANLAFQSYDSGAYTTRARILVTTIGGATGLGFIFSTTLAGGAIAETMRVTSVGVQVTGGIAIGAAVSASAALLVPAGTTAIASLRVPHGVAPTSPVNGDIWSTTTALFVRINGVTKQVAFA